MDPKKLSATAKFLHDNFDCVDNVVEIVSRHFAPPKRETVKKWFQRGSVPGDWLLILAIALQKEHGRPVKLPHIETTERALDDRD